ncbi:MAG: dephospho-CoA kinase [Deltaproteobacteria bacterium]|nr:dephospho-CoA kinase [Deltaproteobacteria bacterium]
MSLKKIGLTGGVGAGKSTVAELLRKEGVVVIDLDAIGQQLLDKNRTVRASIRNLFGEAAFHGDQINRKAIREIIFTDVTKRQKLEALLHPLILDRFNKLSAKAQSERHSVIVCEAALLIESGYHKQLDGLIVVTASETTRLRRLMERDHISESLAQQMIRSQLPQSEKTKHATEIIDNDGDKTMLHHRVTEVLARLKTAISSSLFC